MTFDPQLRELQLVFIEEAKQLLNEAEETLLQLEQTGFSTDLVNRAFRVAHNFKGSAHSVGFQELGQLAHKYEDILSSLKSGSRLLSPGLISALLHCTDTLRREILALQSNPEHRVDVLAELSALKLAESLPIEPPTPVSEAEQSSNFFNKEASPPPTPATERPRSEASSAPSSKQEEATLKIPAARLDALLNIIGELVVNQSILDDCRAQGAANSEQAEQSISYMSKLISDLQNLSLSLRLVPIKPLFQKLRRTARDVAANLQKDIHFIEEGDYCELDKGVIESMSDPLNHMVRNAVDHGVDTAAERSAVGKPSMATVKVSALTQDDQVKIIVSDDGRGLNREKILAKAIAQGLVPTSANLTEQETFALIFAPGFSTKEQVSDVSGRGVGMEVVQRAIEDLKGTIQISSTQGKGTSFEISLPLSLSIIGGMVIQANGQRFVVPVSQLVETIELSKYSLETVTGLGQTVNLRGEVLPVYHLNDLLLRRQRKGLTRLNEAKSRTVSRPALITHLRGKKVSFEVEQIWTQQKIVLKRLGREFDGIPGVVAGAILSNGEPGLVLSLDKLAAGMER